MRELHVQFIFHGVKDQPMTNDLIFQLRREVSRRLEASGFGASIELEDGRTFENDFAVPVIDAYIDYENELHISYIWLYPLALGHGDMAELVNNQIPRLMDFVSELNVCLIYRSSFL